MKEGATLSSFVYIPDENDVPEGSLALPWNRNNPEKQLSSLDTYQITGLTYGCREAKESLMSDSGTKKEKLRSSMIANTVSTELTRDEANETLINRFFT